MTEPTEIARVLVCLDNRVGYESLKYMLACPATEVCGVIVHPEKNALLLEEISHACAEASVPVFDVLTARERFDELVAPLRPDFLISLYFDYILDDRFLELPRVDAINLHPGYLPYNKGFYYYVWAVLDGTPAGVSIHRMVADVDAGDLVAQARIDVTPEDTGESLYRKHEDQSIQLFQHTWPSVRTRTCKGYRQLHHGTRHKLREAKELLPIDPNEVVSARELINRLRVCTFPGASGCTIRIGGRNYQINLSLKELTDEGSNKLPGKTVKRVTDMRQTGSGVAV